MKVFGAPTGEVVALASELGLGVEWKRPQRRDGRTANRHIALRPLGARYALTIEFDDDSKQKVVCQHGHEAFLLALFERFPHARVITPIADYRGLEGFVEIQPSVREKYLKTYGVDPCTCQRAKGGN